MRKLGLIGGMSWASTAIYYEKINRGVRQRLGGRHSAPLIIESLDFEPIANAQSNGEWDVLGDQLAESARRLAGAGAEGLVLCSNTMHKLYDYLTDAVDIPVLHVGDVTAAAMHAVNISRAALFGTRFTMSEGFLRDRLKSHGIELAIPDPDRMAEIDRIIFDELVMGEARVESKRTMKTFITNLEKAGNEAVILGCTELVMVVNTSSAVLPIFDTTSLHADAALEWILGAD
ncbi:amino acid racemase [Parasphingopyxis algicola]|uniref:aspartate/glutamate racemase family protein n=1 Tax=Parasphingopyxis algicola TaxID=2026624 RepID=UPI0015A1F962|nr:amino acid racemase [Parasphingopyxis algicola]QLC23612.1 amino acid racemase [Parasphingopyxis algicola]